VNLSPTPNLRTHEDRADLRELLISLETALMGVEAVPDTGCPPHPATAAALGPGSRCRPVDLGPGLWAVLRTSPDGTNQVLCVHNPTDEPVAFAPGVHFDGSGTEPLLFLRGAATSGGTETAVTCRLDARGFVWLGRFADSPTL
jgi:2,3-bisphosphoglycerate-independent phosphoglycerate mutase